MQTLTLTQRSLYRDFTIVLLASFAISLSGKLAIPLWFTPVPLTLQNMAVLFTAVLLGSRRGAAATFAFLAQGALGLPVFSTGAAGFIYFLKASAGGYLIGYLIASYVTGYLAERSQTLTQTFGAMIAGHLIIYLCGASYLSTAIGIKQALLLGVAPFILGDLFKTLFCLKALKLLGR